MKITVEHEGVTASVDDPGVVTAGQAVDLWETVMLALGYHPDSVESALEDLDAKV